MHESERHTCTNNKARIAMTIQKIQLHNMERSFNIKSYSYWPWSQSQNLQGICMASFILLESEAWIILLTQKQTKTAEMYNVCSAVLVL